MKIKIYALMLALLVTSGLSCSPKSTPAFIKPAPPDDKVIQDNTQVFDPQVDILFVVDNSGSMGEHQQNLSTNVTQFTSAFTKASVLDYNIGVVTTDTEGYYGNNIPCCGKMVGSIRVVNKSTPNADQVLANNLIVGTDGSSVERMFDPINLALSPANLTGWNVGFLRPNATLVVIIITDAEDQSDNNTADSTYQFLLNLKQGNKDKLLAYGAIVPTKDTMNCPRDDGTPPTKIESFLAMMNNNKNNVFDLCDPDYGTRLSQLAKDIVNKVGNVIYLNRAPDINSIHVYYGSMELPMDFHKGWSFDADKNAIFLGDQVDWSSQPSGSRVKVSYNAAKYD